MNSTSPPDERERELALDPGQSFLVQAPAGAGKTELLIQRYLRLLAQVEEPEEILAITFTRKAAAEMHRRICQSLWTDDDGTEPTSTNVRRLRALVAAVRARDAARGWGLLAYPARLRISTIDGLNSALARSQPYASGGQVLRNIVERAGPLYRRAARQTVALLAEPGPAGQAVADLLAHLDNQPVRLEAMLATLLERRDQWLPILGAGPTDASTARERLESVLARIVAHELGQLEGLVPQPLLEELREVMAAAAINTGVTPGGGPGSDVPLALRLAWWRHAGQTLLTKDGHWRTKLDKRQGFPPEQKDLKAHAVDLLARLAACHGLEQHLDHVGGLPEPVYPEAQWSALLSLLRLLPLAAAELKLVFAAEGATDFIEIAAEARGALGQDDEPSELALRMDLRVRHVLVDEFQDTSLPQYELLRALTRGWVPGDGRTLFLVGDPMQSVYRFRQAEVRLFLETRDHGLPGVPLRFLRLSANFRSVNPIVTWVNRVFPIIFPRRDDLLTSAVAFAPSESCVADPGQGGGAGALPAAGVQLHASPPRDPGEESSRVVAVVQDCLRRWPAETVGILVRSRGHAGQIVAGLRQAGVGVAASDLVQLRDTAVADDLLALAHALLHAADRLAWLGVLRGPCGGLSLADLERLANAAADRSIGDACRDESALAALSADGRERATRVATALDLARRRLGQLPLRDVLEGLWTELGGPVHGATDPALADLVLQQIAEEEAGGNCGDILDLDDAVSAAPSAPPVPGAQVQVLTIHKAKGLQFDTVIVPGLGRLTQRDSRPALLWEEMAVDDGRAELVLAPVNPAGSDKDPLYELLWQLKSDQAAAESDRLLYVAATRACKRLHLFGQVAVRKAGAEPRPAPGSLLARLWPAIGPEWPEAPALPEPGDEDDPTRRWITPPHYRLPGGWQRPAPPAGVRPAAGVAAAPVPPPPFDWAKAWTIHAGSVAHRWLQHIANRGVEHVTTADIRSARARISHMLVRAGVGAPELEQAVRRVERALTEAITDPQGRWILSSERAQAVNEYAITVAAGGDAHRLIVDRSFVDEDGVRWIVDYKTGSHEGGDRDRFLRAEASRYGPALAAYREAWSRLEARPVQTALYFPLLQALLRVDPPGSRPAGA